MRGQRQSLRAIVGNRDMVTAQCCSDGIRDCDVIIDDENVFHRVLPRRFLAGQHHRQPIEVGDDAAIHGLVDREQSCLVSEELPDRDLLFTLLPELGPVVR